jgi:hypothetical protein
VTAGQPQGHRRTSWSARHAAAAWPRRHDRFGSPHRRAAGLLGGGGGANRCTSRRRRATAVATGRTASSSCKAAGPQPVPSFIANAKWITSSSARVMQREEGVSSRPGAALRTLFACAARRAAPQESCHPIARSGKPLQPHCRGGHVDMDAARAATIGRSSGPAERKDKRTSHRICRHTAAASVREYPREMPARKEVERWSKLFWSLAVTTHMSHTST